MIHCFTGCWCTCASPGRPDVATRCIPTPFKKVASLDCWPRAVMGLHCRRPAQAFKLCQSHTANPHQSYAALGVSRSTKPNCTVRLFLRIAHPHQCCARPVHTSIPATLHRTEYNLTSRKRSLTATTNTCTCIPGMPHPSHGNQR